MFRPGYNERFEDKENPWEFAEANCSCGWFGSADELTQTPVILKGMERIWLRCPRCEEDKGFL